MSTSNTISVIIPVYNVVGFLDRCLETVVDQTYADLEILLIDDGSTDGSGALCDQWEKRDERVKTIHTANGGAAAARNTGLNAATGEYIMFVDADDYLAKDMCQRLQEALMTYDAECSVCGVIEVEESGAQRDKKAVEAHWVMSGVEAICERYFHQNEAMQIVGPCGKLFRKSMWQECRFTPGMYYEDLDVMPYLYTPCERMVFIPDVGYYYYQRRESASRGTGTDDKRYTDSVLIRQKHIRFYQEIGQSALAAHMAQRLADLIITSACNGWIPKTAEHDSRRVFGECATIVKAQRTVAFKNKLRYTIFQYFGTAGYRLLVQRKKGA